MKKFLLVLPVLALLLLGGFTSVLAAPPLSTALPSSTPWATEGTHVEWPTDVPLTPCPMTPEPTVTALTTLDIPTLDFPTDEGTGMPTLELLPTGTVTPTGTPGASPYKILLYEADDYAVELEDGSVNVDLSGDSRVGIYYSPGIAHQWWFYIDDLPSAPVTLYYQIIINSTYGLLEVPGGEYCDDEVLRWVNGSSTFYFYDHASPGVPIVADHFNTPFTSGHCERIVGDLDDLIYSGSFVLSAFPSPDWHFSLYYGTGTDNLTYGFTIVSVDALFSLSPIDDDPPDDGECGLDDGGGDGGACVGDMCIILDPPGDPIPGACYVLIPHLIDIDLPDDLIFFGVELPDAISVPGFQVCTQYYPIVGSFFGVDLSILATILAFALTLGVLWSMFA